ncbi:lactate racemase domain-containing protein [Paenibacillus solisilvae]|uniref:Lactate racemase domain-containing protein n=1 Tax=Paenibacillus solisilvae TaxID=2486751 RepID=A0ABW0VTM0_9BACL
MGILQELVKDIPIPRMAKVKVNFDETRIDDLASELLPKLQREAIAGKVRPGMEIAIAVGSRGLDRLLEITAVTVKFLQDAGAKPFIVPSMGSHGGATGEGQREVLAHLGITKETVGCEIRSSMEVVQIGELPNGLPVFVDQFAAAADGMVVINRIKPHTAFRGEVESGMMKMISIGLGKQKGAEACHQLGFKYMAENVPAMAKMIMEHKPLLFGVASVENAFDKVALIETMTPDEIVENEPALLVQAKALLPKLYFDQLDVLIIDQIGKNISGDGMDPNITGRYPTSYAHGGPDVNKMAVLDLTHQSEGNANGVGTADFTAQRLVDKMDLEKTYANGLTSTVVAPTKIATTLPNDRETIQASIKTCNILHFEQVRMVRIKNTLELGVIEVSEALLDDVRRHPKMEVVQGLYELSFDNEGNLF